MSAPTSSPSSTVSRRTALGGLAAGVVAAAFPGFTPANAAVERPFAAADLGRPKRRPNLLFILAEDMGWGDLSSYGAPQAKTPHLDRLAASGIRYTQGYSAASVCSPTRFALYTGRYPGFACRPSPAGPTPSNVIRSMTPQSSRWTGRPPSSTTRRAVARLSVRRADARPAPLPGRAPGRA